MTKKSSARQKREQFNSPHPRNIASVFYDQSNPEQIKITTNDILQNLLYRDGPKTARSFDRHTKTYIAEISKVYSRVVGMMLPYLDDINSQDYKSTSARLLFGALNTYAASIEAARHGYRRQFGMLSRGVIEILATVVAITIKEGTLEQFHEDKLSSTYCVGIAKKIFPSIGKFYGLFSKEFVHIGKGQSNIEPPELYAADQPALLFIIHSLKSSIWLALVITEMVFFQEQESLNFWRHSADGGVEYAPTLETVNWTDTFLAGLTTESLIAAMKR